MSRPTNPPDEPERRTNGEVRDQDGGHPEELLAVFADGVASPSEAAEVEAHLGTCAACRSDLTMARGAMRALHELPELPSPWVDAASIAGDSSGGGGDLAPRTANVTSIDDHRRRRRGRIAAAVGLAAAAALVVGVFVAQGGGGGGDASSAGSQPEAASSGGTNVSRAALDHLVRDLAGGRVVAGGEDTVGGAALATSAPPPGSSPTAPERSILGASVSPTIAPGAERAVSCTREAAGQPDSAVVVYAAPAVFEHQHVWVIGFITAPTSGGDPRVTVVATTVDGCAVVYEARQPLAG